MRDWFAASAGRPSVSLIYNKIIDCITKPLSIKTIWNRELSDLNLSVDWERVWSNLSLTSKNLAHRLIHFKVIHRAYITPYKRFKMKLQPNFNCHICNTASSGTLLHMFWECPIIINLWTHVNLVLSSLLQIDWSVNPSLCLLNDDSGLCISSMQKRMLFAGFTAAKETIIQNWFTQHMCKHGIDVNGVEILQQSDDISDHYLVLCKLHIVKAVNSTPSYKYGRTITSTTKDCFVSNLPDLSQFLSISNSSEQLDDVTETMNSLFSSTLDTVAPLRLRKIKENSLTPWYNEHTRTLKRAARKMERSWRKTKLEVFRLAWKAGKYPILQKSFKNC